MKKQETKTFLDVTGKKVLVPEKIENLIKRLQEINENLTETSDLYYMFKKIDVASREEEVASTAREGESNGYKYITIRLNNEAYFVVAYKYNKNIAIDVQKLMHKTVFCLGIQKLED